MTPDPQHLKRVSHDMSMVHGERHALSADCPCGPDLDSIGVYYHLPLEDRDDLPDTDR